MLVGKNPLELLSTDPVELNLLSLKSKLMMILTMLIDERGFTQAEAASFFGVSQPRVSNLKMGKISKFSIDILLEMLGRMGFMMDISFDPTSRDNPISVNIKKSAV